MIPAARNTIKRKVNENLTPSTSVKNFSVTKNALLSVTVTAVVLVESALELAPSCSLDSSLPLSLVFSDALLAASATYMSEISDEINTKYGKLVAILTLAAKKKGFK